MPLDWRLAYLTRGCPLAATQVVHCVENGLPLLIENLPEDIDPVLDAIIQKKARPAA